MNIQEIKKRNANFELSDLILSHDGNSMCLTFSWKEKENETFAHMVDKRFYFYELISSILPLNTGTCLIEANEWLTSRDFLPFEINETSLGLIKSNVVIDLKNMWKELKIQNPSLCKNTKFVGELTFLLICEDNYNDINFKFKSISYSIDNSNHIMYIDPVFLSEIIFN
jgi:hypothetical protein